VADDAHVAIRVLHLEVAVIGREPLIDDVLDVERALAQPEAPRRLLAAIAGVALDGDVKRRQNSMVSERDDFSSPLFDAIEALKQLAYASLFLVTGGAVGGLILRASIERAERIRIGVADHRRRLVVRHRDGPTFGEEQRGDERPDVVLPSAQETAQVDPVNRGNPRSSQDSDSHCLSHWFFHRAITHARCHEAAMFRARGNRSRFCAQADGDRDSSSGLDWRFSGDAGQKSDRPDRSSCLRFALAEVQTIRLY